MTPLEKALKSKDKVYSCYECKRVKIVNDTAYCSVDGKLIHPLMLEKSKSPIICKDAERNEK